MMNPRRGLALQINRRLLLSLVLASSFTVLIGVWVYWESNQPAHDARLKSFSAHLVAALSQIERNWGREAYNYRMRLEYSRLLDDPNRRQARLTNYLTAQGGSTIFPHMRVIERDGSAIAMKYWVSTPAAVTSPSWTG